VQTVQKTSLTPPSVTGSELSQPSKEHDAQN